MAEPERLHLPEDVRDDRPRLGRHIARDPRSLDYMIEGSPLRRLATVHHERFLPILDQARLGSCTGNALVGLLGTHPFWPAVGAAEIPDDADQAEDYAIGVYSDATRLDGFPGVWRPDDTGSTGLAVCKVGRARGLFRSYRWARTSTGLVRLLQDAPALLGMAWLEEFFEPDRDGFIDSGDLSSSIAGGHEVEIVGVDYSPTDPSRSVLTIANSWSPGWGDAGYFRMRLATYERFRDYADIKQPVM